MGIQRYQILTFFFILIAVALLVLYRVLSNNCPDTANILLGISTGLISGIVLLFVTGLKSKDRGRLEEQLIVNDVVFCVILLTVPHIERHQERKQAKCCDVYYKAVCEINDALLAINQLADSVIHKTYKCKADKMSIGEYTLILRRCIHGLASNDISFEGLMRKMFEALEWYEYNSIDKKTRKRLRQKIEKLNESITSLADYYEEIMDFIEKYDIDKPSISSDSDLMKVARSELNHVAHMCWRLFHLPPRTEHKLEQKIRAEITRMDRSLI